MPGRILYLTADAGLVLRQLDGEDLDWKPNDPGQKLRDDLSTDEMTPGWVCFHHDRTLGEFVYLGLTCDGAGGKLQPVGEGAVRAGGFVASVAGRRRGKGSSREQAPYAELSAGIRIVVAESFERIYLQNCVNLGLLPTDDFSVLDLLRRGEEVPLERFTEGLDPVTREIVRRGGLAPFNRARLSGELVLPFPGVPSRAMTLAEKILARRMVTDARSGAAGVDAVAPGVAGFVRTDLRFSHEYVTPMAANLFEEVHGAGAPVADPESVVFFRDHLTLLGEVMPEERKRRGLLGLADGLALRQEEFAAPRGIPVHTGSICHSKVLESYALPGQVVVGSDSHTTMAGALGCLAFGIGTTDLANAWWTRDARITVPPTIRVELTGRAAAGVTAKDFVLALLAHPFVRGGGAVGKFVEFGGGAVSELPLEERATLTNMAAEIGAFAGLVPADEVTARFLEERRGLPASEAARLCSGWEADPGADYESVLALDVTDLSPMVALPGDPGNGVFLSDLAAPVPIDIAYGGSCTGGKRTDMEIYAAVLAEGLAEGRRVAGGVEFFIQFGSLEVREWCEGRGYLDLFSRAGVTLLPPGCGACINAGPGVSTRPDQVTVSAINRNFPGRSGPGKVYLASPAVVAASALAGRIAVWRPTGGMPQRRTE
jgi:3-isopropylmalate/(R)-2-methylmalate dehydratase large subunit